MATNRQHLLDLLLNEVRACQLCTADLPLGARPVIAAAPDARILIIGQAPGTRVHHSGIAWNDPSGDTLRQWLEIDRGTFYDSNRIAIMPMGLCYPGKGKSGDLPPRPECAPRWHARVRAHLQEIQLTLLIGQYAQRYYLPDASATLAQTVRRYAEFGPDFIPLPHPSPRNRRWLKNNPWLEAEVVPELRLRVKHHLNAGDATKHQTGHESDRQA